jgi:glutamate/aspartate transport system substrate-binding protein
MRSRGSRVALLVAVALLAASSAGAQELTGTLKRIKETGSVTLGYRTSSLPFSYLGRRGEPIGYAIDLCKAVVEDIAAELDGMTLDIAYKPVTSETRIPAVVSGQIDLECGSTTSNVTRKKLVAFSPVYFVSGTKLLVKRGSGIRSWRDLGGKTVVVTSGTTNEAAIRAIAEKQQLAVNLVTGSDHQHSFDMLKAGAADAFATDDVLLYGLLAASKSGAAYHVVGDFLSYDPYALMFRKDDADFAAVVERSFARLASSREIVQLYDKWFLQRLPTGERLDLAMSPQLEELFRALGVSE